MTHPTPTTRRPGSRGFSLIELVIVVVIIGIIGAIAIPRLSRGARGATLSRTLNDLAVMNKALDHYAAEHAGAYPSTAADVEALLTTYSDAQGNASDKPGTVYIYGPYLREVPDAAAGMYPGTNTIGSAPGQKTAWLYDAANGRIYLNRGLAVSDPQMQIQLTDELLRAIP